MVSLDPFLRFHDIWSKFTFSDAATPVSVLAHCLRSKNYVNLVGSCWIHLIVAGVLIFLLGNRRSSGVRLIQTRICLLRRRIDIVLLVSRLLNVQIFTCYQC